MSYTFAKHETFHIRTGWLRKGLKAIEKNDHIFLEKINAMDELGIGKNMVSSLRYWLTVTGLTKESYKKGQKVQSKTELANLILKYDKYFEDPATFWLLHYNLAQEKEDATTWYWFYNFFNYQEFDEELFLNELNKYIKRTGGKEKADSSLRKDFRVLTNMYLFDSTENKKPDDSMESPFSELKLIIKPNKNYYKINKATMNSLPPKILYFCLLDNNVNKENLNVENVLDEINSIGKIFKLNLTNLYNYLEKLSELNYIKLEKYAGMNSIKLLKKDKENILKNYYNSKG